MDRCVGLQTTLIEYFLLNQSLFSLRQQAQKHRRTINKQTSAKYCNIPVFKESKNNCGLAAKPLCKEVRVYTFLVVKFCFHSTLIDHTIMKRNKTRLKLLSKIFIQHKF